MTIEIAHDNDAQPGETLPEKERELVRRAAHNVGKRLEFIHGEPYVLKDVGRNKSAHYWNPTYNNADAFELIALFGMIVEVDKNQQAAHAWVAPEPGNLSNSDQTYRHSFLFPDNTAPDAERALRWAVTEAAANAQPLVQAS